MRFLTANKIFDGKRFLPDDAVLALNNANGLEEIITDSSIEENRIERLEGVITPGFVNSHCHLELSHLKDKIPQHTGLPEFAKQIILSRNTAGKEQVAESMQEADRTMWQNGIVAVGDISNTRESFVQKAGSPVFYHTFLELIGLNPANAESVFEKGLELYEDLRAMNLQGSLAPHAPYSTSRELIAKIAVHNRRQNTSGSIHNQESVEETKFFMGSQNGFEALYRFLGLDTSWFKPPGHSSLLQYADVLPSTPFILVHNTLTQEADVKVVKEKNIFWCFCPAANQYIESALPDFALFGQQAGRICMGTDSLASNASLDLVREANLILKATSAFSLETILQAMTYNGAVALGISNHYGQLHTGKKMGLNLIRVKDSELHFLKKIM